MTAAETTPETTSASARTADAAATAFNRTISPISGRLGGGKGAKIATVAALGVGCGVFMLVSGHHGPSKPAAPTEAAAQVVPFEPAKPGAAPTLAQPGATPPVLDPTASTLGGAQPAPAGGAGSANAQTAQSAAKAAAQAKAAQVQAIRAAPILAFGQGGGQGGGGLASQTPASVMAAPAAEASAHATSELDQLRQGSTIGLERAKRLPNRHFLITAGTSIPCTLQTAMDTATPGYVSCVIGSDVYAEDGAVVLMEKGSKVLGEYRSGMRQGQSRLFVLWTRAVTPGGVAIGLASPASDPLGRAGFDGVIDTHFWARFGGALLLSVIDDSSAAVASHADPNGETVRVPSDAAAVALQNSINIPPSLTKAQGSEVSIFVAQDLDFSSVYALKAR
jgi:type IV secretion system protein VirB10